MSLTPKQQQFCYEYLLDFNQAAAYQRAGYCATGHSAESNASRLLRNAEVQGYLLKLRKDATARAQLSIDEVLQEIAAVAFSRITDACEWDAEGIRLNPSVELSEDAKAAIALVKMTPRSTAVKMHNKVAALTLLADYFGFRDDFNKARQTLYRYGLSLQPDESAPAGWQVYPVGFEPATGDADRAVVEFFGEC